jgi:hypothetical protein
VKLLPVVDLSDENDPTGSVLISHRLMPAGIRARASKVEPPVPQSHILLHPYFFVIRPPRLQDPAHTPKKVRINLFPGIEVYLSANTTHKIYLFLKYTAR